MAVFALVAAGGVAAGLSLAANANEFAICDSSASPGTTSAPIECSFPNSTTTDTTINTPSAIQAEVTLLTSDNATTADQYVLITYTVYCSQGGNQETTSNPTTNPPQAITTSAPVTETLTLGFTDPDSCTVESLTAVLEAGSSASTATADTTGSFEMELEWTPASSASSTSSTSSTVSVSTIKGYDDKCIDDKGNSSGNKTEVIIWTCNSGDSAQGWTYSSSELKHNDKCANDEGSGGSGSKVILWTCNGASNEKWFHSSSDGEFILDDSAHGLLCLDDPGYSKTNRTQLIVYHCHNSSNQHWN
jgi:Ricin-type beta-trefoil lectin domain